MIDSGGVFMNFFDKLILWFYLVCEDEVATLQQPSSLSSFHPYIEKYIPFRYIIMV